MRAMLLASVAAAAVSAAAFPSPARAQVSESVLLTWLIRTSQDGYTQVSNYIKGQTDAIQQTFDASNVAMGRFFRNIRNAQVRDEHVPTPAACEAADNGQSILVGAGQSWVVSNSINRISDRRGEGEPGTPAFHGQAQGAGNARAMHAQYCSEREAADGICRATERPNWDQRASSLLGVLSYGDEQANVTAANDFLYNYLQPVPLRALRGDEAKSVAGQQVEAWRRNYAAMHSYARLVATEALAGRTNSVTLTPSQREQQTRQGLVPTTRSSWMQAMELEVNRYALDTAWAIELQRMPAKAVMIEQAKLAALQNYIVWQTFKATQHTSVGMAGLVADRAEAMAGNRREEALRKLLPAPTPLVR